jgi:hypothetical protein
VIEIGLVAAGQAQTFAGEKPFQNCDGVRLAFDGAKFVAAKILRADAA